MRRMVPRSSSPDACVERPERLVEQQHLGAVGERAGQRHPLLLAARELARHAPAEAGEADELEQLVAPPPALGLAGAAHAQRELDVLGDGHLAEEGVALEDEADAAPLRRRAGHVAAVEQHAPAVGVGEARDHAQQRALAAAAGAQHDAELALRHLERHVVHDRMAGVALGDPFEHDRHASSVPLGQTLPAGGDTVSRRAVTWLSPGWATSSAAAPPRRRPPRGPGSGRRSRPRHWRGPGARRAR